MSFDIEAAVKEYPLMNRFRANTEAVKRLYATLHPKTDFSNVSEDMNISGAEVLIAQMTWDGDRLGCPECSSTLKGELGSTMSCSSSRCGGQQREVTRLHSTTYYATDELGNPIYLSLSFGVNAHDLTGVDNPKELEGKVATVTGKIGKQKGWKKEKLHGGETVERPVLNVRKMTITADVKKVGMESLDATTSIPSKPTEEFNPTPQVSSDKVPVFVKYLKMLGTVEESTLKNYAINNLQLKWEDVSGLLVGDTDAEGKTYFRLKG